MTASPPQSPSPLASDSQPVSHLESQPASPNLSDRLPQFLTQTTFRWIAQHLLLTLFLLWTPVLLLQTWNIQHSCFPFINWGTDRCPIASITVSPSTLSLKAGDSHTLKATVSVKATLRNVEAVNRNVTWTSSNEKIATVDDRGRVHAVAPGIAQITATSEKDDTQKDTVSVVAEGITQVVLQPKSLAIAVGEARALTSEVQGIGKFNSAIAWSSSDSRIATVDQNGSVQGIAKGTAVIQAASRQDSSKTATVKVTVSHKVAIDRITIQAKESIADLRVGAVQSLSALVEGLGANSEDVLWSSSNPAVIELVSQGQQAQLAAKSIGEATVTATSNQDRSKKAILSLTVLPPVITRISLHPSSLELDLNQQTRICTKVSGKGAIDSTVSWSSSNPRVATVDDQGIITAHTKGKAKIIATSRQDSNQTAIATLKTPKGFNWLTVGVGAIITLGATAVGVPLPVAIALGAAAATGVGSWHGNDFPTCR